MSEIIAEFILGLNKPFPFTVSEGIDIDINFVPII